MKRPQNEILRYQKGRQSQETVRRHFEDWRSEQDPPIPMRCDNSSCLYYSEPLIWNGLELKLILDHKNGVCGDNRPKNLQFLCPNCNSQQSTHGGVTRVRLFKAKEVLRMLEAIVKRTIHYLQNLERTIILAVTLN